VVADGPERAAGQNGHQVSVAVASVWIDGDPVRIEQVVANLVSNALRYTPEGGRIDVAVREEDGRAVLTVRDTGIGLAPEMTTRIFGLFVRGGLSSRGEAAGLGVGLALARRLVELHGGTIDAASAGVGRGSTFTVRLPLAVRAAALHPSAAPAR
jgi:two-component system, sensor histidine kinase